MKSPKSNRPPLSHDERLKLWEQFVGVHAEAQKVFDDSVRTIAAAGVAVTVSLATALKGLDGKGVASVALFLASLGFNVVSYATAQLDMNARLDSLREGRSDGVDGNAWTKATTAFNVGQGVAVIAGGALLAAFIKSNVG
jgi:hypothetical protein